MTERRAFTIRYNCGHARAWPPEEAPAEGAEAAAATTPGAASPGAEGAAQGDEARARQ
jgi:hypothetical protein